MWYNFWLQNSHFGVEIFIGLVFFATAWLYLDSWGAKKEAKTLLRALGFFSLALWAVLGATSSEFSALRLIETIAKFTGLAFVLISFIIDPVPKIPRLKKSSLKKKASGIIPVALSTSVFFQPSVFSSILLLVISCLILIRFTKGLIKEWRGLFLAFLLFTLSELITILYFWQDSSNIVISRILQTYGAVWFTEHGLKLLGFIILARWTWGYIRFRLVPQFFITYLTIIFLIFVGTTFAFTTILLRTVEQDQLTQLKVNVQTVEYAIDQLDNEAVLAAKIASENVAVKDALANQDVETLYAVTNRLMLENGTDFFIVVNDGADVLIRAEDRSKIGDNLADDPVVGRAFEGRSVASAATEEDITAPIVSIRAASPVLSSEGKIIGAVITGYIIDNAFVDGVKKVTDLDVTIFGGKYRSATTLFTPGSTSRDTGLVETDTRVVDQVLTKAGRFTSSINVLNTPFYAAYAPLLDIDNTVIGMLSIGRPQSELLAATDKTIRTTFIISVILMMLAMLPAYFLARYISRYQRV
ncbi:MAG: cache domain-containing protein [Patescibacteria group bacterium]|nr:cache domain-containing protein [Patescibacteria group bacterium]